MTTENLEFWTPLIDDNGTEQGLERVVQRDGFTVTGVWTETGGYGVYIDNDSDNPFRLAQLQDLWETVRVMTVEQPGTGPQTARDLISAAVEAGDYDRAAELKAAVVEAQQPDVNRVEEL